MSVKLSRNDLQTPITKKAYDKVCKEFFNGDKIAVIDGANIPISDCKIMLKDGNLTYHIEFGIGKVEKFFDRQGLARLVV